MADATLKYNGRGVTVGERSGRFTVEITGREYETFQQAKDAIDRYEKAQDKALNDLENDERKYLRDL